MKDIILNMGGKFLTIIVALSYIVIVISGIATMGQGFWIGLFTLLGGIVANTLLFYFIYNIIDIRDSLREINAKKS